MIQKRYLFDHFYRGYRVMRMAAKAEMILTRLFEAYIHQPRQLRLPPWKKSSSLGMDSIGSFAIIWPA